MEEHNKYKKKAKLIKILLYSSLLISLLTLIIATTMSLWFSRSGNLFFVKLVASTLRSLKVAPANISGISDNGTKYYITSKSLKNYIENFLTKQDIYFDKPYLLLLDKEGLEIQINALNGNISSTDSKIYLNKDIKLTSNNGYEASASSLIFDPKTFMLYSEEKIESSYQNNKFSANGFKIYDNFKKITITGPVTLEIENP